MTDIEKAREMPSARREEIRALAERLGAHGLRVMNDASAALTELLGEVERLEKHAAWAEEWARREYKARQDAYNEQES